MTDKLKNVLIGAFAMLSITIIIGTILFMQPSIGDGKKNLRVRFSDIAGINIGTRVNFAGKPVGDVKDISIVQAQFPFLVSPSLLLCFDIPRPRKWFALCYPPKLHQYSCSTPCN